MRVRSAPLRMHRQIYYGSGRPMEERGEDDPVRPALRAGHPESWDVLVAGTSLAGMRYPTPTRLSRIR
jgi:hypothetical protein